MIYNNTRFTISIAFSYLLIVILVLSRQATMTTMDNEWDVMPAGRRKSIHPNGAVCRFNLHINNSPYSGLLKNGKRTGIMRLSSIVDGETITIGHGESGPVCDPVCEESGPSGSAALKFLRTGIPSGNLFVQRLPIGFNSSTYNVLDSEVNVLYTHRNGLNYALRSFKGIIKDLQGSAYSFAVGVSDLARYFYY